MQTFTITPQFRQDLLAQLPIDYRIFGPVHDDDGICRLREISSWPETRELPRIPLKKFLLPPEECLYIAQDGMFNETPPPEPVAVLGVAACDLYAIGYLDRVFAEDPHYQRRRQRLFLVGVDCQPDERCFCPPHAGPPPFDLFLSETCVESGSPLGDSLLQVMKGSLGKVQARGIAWQLMASGPTLPPDLEQRWPELEADPIWEEIGGRCLACGACSATCPTCYCFDMQDRFDADGRAIRTRVWDNCFFANFAEVAGGHDFRPTRGERFRFRCEHKLLGFGAERGTGACVGCGRCRSICPVGIDVQEVVTRFRWQGAP